MRELLLAVAGGGLGFLLAAGMRVFVKLAPSNIPEIEQASLDLRVFAVAAELALAAVGIWPAMSVLRSRALQYGARATAAARPRMRFTLVTVQIALTVAMLAGSALLLRTLGNLVSVPLGYESERVVIMNVALNPALLHDRVAPSVLRAVTGAHPRDPGNAAATIGNPASAGAGGILTSPSVDRRPRPPDDGTRFRVREATPGYFLTLAFPFCGDAPSRRPTEERSRSYSFGVRHADSVSRPRPDRAHGRYIRQRVGRSGRRKHGTSAMGPPQGPLPSSTYSRGGTCRLKSARTSPCVRKPALTTRSHY